MKKRQLIALLCGMTMTAALAGCGGSESSQPAQTNGAAEKAVDSAEDEKTFHIDLATAYAADAPAGIALAEFVENVAEKSGGTIDISLFTDGTLGSASDNYSSVASGDLDMSMTGLEG